MPMLDELLRSGGADGGAMGAADPQVEQLLGRLSSVQNAVRGPGGQPQGAPQPGMMQGPATSQGTPMAPSQPGASGPMAPEQANLTYQMLIKAGVPPEIAKQAIAEPKFLQEILMQMQKQQLGAPPAQPQGGPAAPQRPMA